MVRRPEEWKPIPWAPGYEASDQGRARSLDRIVSVCANGAGGKPRHGHPRRRVGRILTPGIGRYASVNIGGKVVLVHRLIAEVFLGPCPPGLIVRHGTGGPLDNRLSNLSYGTPADNNGVDRLRDGTLPRGDRSGTAKLTEAQVIEIKKRLPCESRAALGRAFGVRPETISHIATGRTWGWVQTIK